MTKRLIAVAVAAVYIVAAIIMIDRADYPWAEVQMALASLAVITAMA